MSPVQTDKRAAAQHTSEDAQRLKAEGTAASLESALEKWQQALDLWREVGDPFEEAETLNSIGTVYDSLGEKQKALDYFDQALPITRAVGGRSLEAKTLSNIGAVNDSLGEKENALNYLNQALPIERALGDSSMEAVTLNNIGLVYSSLGEEQKALDYYNQSLPIRRAVGAHAGEAATLNNIGLVYSSLGQKQKALDYYNQSLQIGGAIGNRSLEAMALNNIGSVNDSLGEKEKALGYLNRALQIEHAIGERFGEDATLCRIGFVYFSMGENKKALDYFNEALSNERAVGDRLREGATLHGIGLVYGALGNNQKALDYYNQALAIRRAIGDRLGEARTLRDIARVEVGMRQLVDARSRMEEALAINESLRTKVVSNELRTSFFACSQACYYELYVDVLMQLHRLHPDEGYDRLAFEASERGRARGLMDLLNEAGAHIYRGANPKLLEREGTIQLQLDAQAQLRIERLSGLHSPSQLSEMEERLRELTTQYEQVESEIRQNSPQYAALTQPHPASVKEIQQQLLDTDTVLLEYSLGAERSYLWLVTSTTVASFELPKRMDVEQASRQTYALLTARAQHRVQADKEYESAATGLSKLLLGKVGSLLGHQRLLIVADGAVNYIPFGALPAPVDDDAAMADSKMKQPPFVPLLVNHEVVQLPSAAVLALLRRETASRPLPLRQVFVLADPVFSANDPRVKHSDHRQGSSSVAQNRTAVANNRNGEVAPIDSSQLARSAEDAGVARGGEDLPRLGGTRQEAKSIGALAPEQSKLALDFEANRTTATSAELAQYRYLHFATHGLVDTQRPELSGLVLSLVTEHGDPVNGFLRLQDIFNLNLPVELVVLSGCETGIGKEVRGEGLLGLTRGFMYAGARRVVVSLWKVDDAATAEFMGFFYEGILRQKLRPAAALRAAQLAMRRDSKWRAPYYWAAFVLQGEWN